MFGLNASNGAAKSEKTAALMSYHMTKKFVTFNTHKHTHSLTKIQIRQTNKQTHKKSILNMQSLRRHRRHRRVYAPILLLACTLRYLCFDSNI